MPPSDVTVLAGAQRPSTSSLSRWSTSSAPPRPMTEPGRSRSRRPATTAATTGAAASLLTAPTAPPGPMALQRKRPAAAAMTIAALVERQHRAAERQRAEQRGSDGAAGSDPSPAGAPSAESANLPPSSLSFFQLRLRRGRSDSHGAARGGGPAASDATTASPLLPMGSLSSAATSCSSTCADLLEGGRPVSRGTANTTAAPIHQRAMTAERETHRRALDAAWQRGEFLAKQLDAVRRQLSAEQQQQRRSQWHQLQQKLLGDEAEERRAIEAEAMARVAEVAVVAHAAAVSQWRRLHEEQRQHKCARPPIRDSALLRALRRAEAHIAALEAAPRQPHPLQLQPAPFEFFAVN